MHSIAICFISLMYVIAGESNEFGHRPGCSLFTVQSIIWLHITHWTPFIYTHIKLTVIVLLRSFHWGKTLINFSPENTISTNQIELHMHSVACMLTLRLRGSWVNVNLFYIQLSNHTWNNKSLYDQSTVDLYVDIACGSTELWQLNSH